MQCQASFGELFWDPFFSPLYMSSGSHIHAWLSPTRVRGSTQHRPCPLPTPLLSPSQRRKEWKRDKARSSLSGKEGRVEEEKLDYIHICLMITVSRSAWVPQFAELEAGRGQEKHPGHPHPELFLWELMSLIREAKPICIGQNSIARNTKIWNLDYTQSCWI